MTAPSKLAGTEDVPLPRATNMPLGMHNKAVCHQYVSVRQHSSAPEEVAHLLRQNRRKQLSKPLYSSGGRVVVVPLPTCVRDRG